MTISNEVYSQENFDWIVKLQRNNSWLLAKKRSEALTELSATFSNENERELLYLLLNDFVYLTSEKEEQSLDKIVEKIISWNLSLNNTVIAAVADQGEVDGSSGGINNLKHQLPSDPEEWSKRFKPTIHDALDAVKNNDTVVLFDDFIGTGSKIIKKVKFFEQKTKDKGILNITVKIICYAAMEEGINKIISEGYDVFSAIELKKGISQRFSGTDLSCKINLMKEMEKKLKKKVKNKRATIDVFSLGYKQSEALYCGANQNCPNNVFPVFWWAELKGGKNRNRLFVRVG